MREYFSPLAKELFARLPEVQCVAYAVSQSWCDEAVDAVHEEFRTFLVRDPRPPYESDAGDALRLRSAFPECADDGGIYVFRERWPRLRENTTAITAFASFCPEQGTIDEPSTLSSAVYALARRGAAGEVAIEVVGTMLRPEGEDRFDVGFAVEPTPDQPFSGRGPSRPLAPSTAAARPRGLWAWLRRWFRG